MKMNKSESKYFNTAKRMDEALLELLSQKDFEFITVKEICEKAGVNRSTFYLHYETIGDLLEESVTYMHEQFYHYFGKNSGDFRHNIETCPKKDLFLITPDYLLPYLKYAKEHRRLYQAAIRRADALHVSRTYEKLCSNILFPILERFNFDRDEKEYVVSYYINGIISIISRWIENGCDVDERKIIEIIQKCAIPKNIPEQFKD